MTLRRITTKATVGPANPANWHSRAGRTVLDRMITGMGRSIRQHALLSDPRAARAMVPYTNYELVHDLVRGIIARHPSLALMMPDEVADSFFAREMELGPAILAATLRPWLIPATGMATLNLQIDEDLADLFMSGKLPGADQWLNIVTSRPVYLDIQSTSQARRICAILTVPLTGSERVSRETMKHFDLVSKLIGEEQGARRTAFGGAVDKQEKEAIRMLVVTERGNQAFDTFIAGSLGQDPVTGNWQMQDLTALLHDPALSDAELERTAQALAAQAAHLLIMSVLYHQVVPPGEEETLPQTDGRSRGRAPRKLQAREKTHSLFRILKLKTPANRFEAQGPKAARKGWSLDYRVSVSRHFRMQHYGAGNQRQKLILIEAYERGKGHRYYPKERPTLEVVEDVGAPAIFPPGSLPSASDD